MAHEKRKGDISHNNSTILDMEKRNETMPLKEGTKPLGNPVGKGYGTLHLVGQFDSTSQGWLASCFFCPLGLLGGECGIFHIRISLPRAIDGCEHEPWCGPKQHNASGLDAGRNGTDRLPLCLGHQRSFRMPKDEAGRRLANAGLSHDGDGGHRIASHSAGVAQAGTPDARG